MLQGDVIMVDGLSAGPFAVWLLSLAADGFYVFRSDLREDPMTKEGYEVGVDAMGSAHEHGRVASRDTTVPDSTWHGVSGRGASEAWLPKPMGFRLLADP